MSLQGLMSGAECAVDLNPLSQVMKHTDGDRSLQQDRLASTSSSRLHYLPGTVVGPSTDRDVQLARQFFDGTGPGAGPSFAMPHHFTGSPQFHMSEMTNAGPLDLNKGWSDAPGAERMQQLPGRPDAAWATEFKPATYSQGPAPSVNQNMIPQADFSPRNQFMSPGMYGIGSMSSGMYASNMTSMNMYNQMMGMQSSNKGKGKLRTEDFESAFDQAAASMNQTESAHIEELSEENFTGLEDAMRDTSLDNKSEPLASMQLPVKPRPQETSDFNSWERVWDQLQKSDLPPPQGDMQKWEAEFNQWMNSQGEDGSDFTSAMNSHWNEIYGDTGSPSDAITYDDEGIPILGDYIFEQNNPYLSQDGPHFLAAAKALLDQNGSLSEAALLLEAAIQKGELGEGGYEAWILLGETRNMDEREEAGIRALTEGVRRALDVGAPGAGMMALAISYTNESYERASHTMLLRWLNYAHPSVEIPEAAWESIKQSAWHSRDKVSEVFLDLARTQHSRGIIDPDVQTGLGVLFYTSNDYDKARDCFETAISAKPHDYQLWNRLGSCLSNGDKHEESLGAYREALNLRPTYVRAIANVAVACLNIGAFQEAAEHLLSALSMQNATAGKTSEQLWLTLHKVLEMSRPDLVDLTRSGYRNIDDFRREGFEF